MGDSKVGKTPPKRQTAANYYEVQPSYKRFNQKFNMTRQGLWEETAIKLRRQRATNMNQNIVKDCDGYTLLDRAFGEGGQANLTSTGFSVNIPNQRGNSWEPLTKRGSRESKSDQLSPRWEGTKEKASWVLRKMGLHFGADQVGFCKLDRRWVYSHWFDEETNTEYPIKFSDEAGYEGYTQPTQLEDKTQVIPRGMQYVAVLLHEMDEEAISASPTLAEWAETRLSYAKISFTSTSLAEFIRSLGYNAIPSANCTALSIPLAIDAGLGQLGRNAKLINPLFGPRCRLSKVITDLPLVVDKPIDFGVTEFCDQCQKCARTCPSGAIPTGERSFKPVNECNNQGVLQWQLNHKKCNEYWASVGTNCGICLRTCPFNKGKGKIHDVARWFIKNLKAVDPLLIKLDDIMGYGKHRSPNKHLWNRND